ncbi:MAG TPA: endopeptidase La [Acidimicrobiales bacterium]|nr:endopeptidase La [Acidimicrobiales bacterium]
MADLETVTLPVLPLTNDVVLPGMVVTLALETDEARSAADAAAKAGDTLLLVPRHPDGRYAAVGTIARIENRGNLPGGMNALVIRATSRAEVGLGVIGQTSGLWVHASPVDDGEVTDEVATLATELRAALRALFEALGGRRLTEVLRGVDDPAALADLVGWWPDLSVERKVELLETLDLPERLRRVLGWVKDALAEHQLSEKIRNDVTEGLEDRQREFLLRQQMDAIRKELGEDDDDSAQSYRERLTALVEAKAVPAATEKAIAREIDRFERTPEQNVEHGWIRNWLDTVFEIPWGERSVDDYDIDRARAVLDTDHTGLDEVKERIVEMLAVRKLLAERAAAEAAESDGAPRADADGDGSSTTHEGEPEAGDEAGTADGDTRSSGGGDVPVVAEIEAVTDNGRRPGAILALAGPPGVGKTSLGASIARALGRKFTRVALGGIRDEAEIRGHRRTYVGAQAGRIVRALQEAGTMNPVILLDEVDKVGADWRGDPSSALLEVLDPAQNHTFRDHYLEVDLDLSDVLFLATANMLETIPGPLLDRMEVIRLDGYTHDEKVAIARDHLFARQQARNGLREGEVRITDAAFGEIVEGYTREAGVRNLEREIGKVLRKVATAVATGAETPIVVDAGDVARYLKRRRFHDEAADRTSVPGVATGLAVTGVGGDVLFVEATSMPGESGMTVTGQLGDVMKESAQIALSYVRSKADQLGIDRADLEGKRFHVHFPAGAIPKDGPSAGITMTTALVSLLRGTQVRSTVAMTGEVTLSGRVLPIGGVKQKVLAAHRAGLREVILPLRNEADLDDVPEAVRAEMSFHPVDDVAKVLDLALEPVERDDAVAA